MRTSEHLLVRAFVLRLAGLVYLIAFLSLWVQIDGLIGSRGILPVGDYVELLSQRLGGDGWTRAPTLLWIDSSDAMLHVLCGLGVLFSCLLIVGFLPAPILIVLWVFYLSLVTGGSTFLSYQWDALLLEFGFAAIWWAPLDCGLRGVWGGSGPSRSVVWLQRWLLFRLMLSSGLVKLLSGDPVWRDLSALQYHYETQPIPTWTSWIVHQCPEWFHALSVGGMLFIEIAVPFAVFANRPVRLAGAAALGALQVAIAATGNYGFFNILTLVLCLSLIDDQLLTRIPFVGKIDLSKPTREWPRIVVLPVVSVLAFLGAFNLAGTARLAITWPAAISTAAQMSRPFYLSSTYGLFAVMTTTRPELIIEGSMDGETWQSYEFSWKAGALDTSPSFAAPHMPRLDWQMWFAALRSYERAPWTSNLLARLLQGSPEVAQLFARTPFDGRSPRFVRIQAYEYSFTTFDRLWNTGEWWRRVPRGAYSPTFSLQQR